MSDEADSRQSSRMTTKVLQRTLVSLLYRGWMIKTGVSRRVIVKTAACLPIGYLGWNNPFLMGQESSSIGSTAAQRQQWLVQAESLKPRLTETPQSPLGVVRPVQDSSRYLRWRMEVEAPGSAVSSRLLKKSDSLLLDFGGHRTGNFGFRLIGDGVSIDAPARLKLTFGEVPGDVAEPLYPYKGQLSSSWLPEEIVTIDFLPQLVRLPRRYSFRYVKIEVVDTSPNFGVRIEDPKAFALTSAIGTPAALPAGTADWIRTVDAVSTATLRDCMQTTFEDGPRRDQRLWIGDLRLQARASYVTYPNHDLVKRCLLLFAGLPRESDGFLPACVFEKPSPSTTGTFTLDYAALYGAILLDYARATNDLDTARQLWPVAHRQFQLLLQYVDQGSIFRAPSGYWAFIDWNMKLDRTAAMQGVIIYALQQLVELATFIGKTSDVAAYPRLLASMRKAAYAAFYDPQQRLCVSGPERQVSWASQAWLTLAGVMTKQEAAEALHQAVIEDQTATKPATAYLYHHVAEAMVTAGMNQEALELIRSYWGLMVEDGADTFWEAFDPADSTFSPYGDVHINSFCHAWSCTPTWFFRSLKLGVTRA